MGAVETLIVWENFDVMRYVLRHPQTQETKVLHLRSDQEKEKSHFQDKETGVEFEHVEEMPLLEWFANNYKNFGKKKKKNFFFMVEEFLNYRCYTGNCDG
jgi:peptide chain release factor subunit 1